MILDDTEIVTIGVRSLDLFRDEVDMRSNTRAPDGRAGVIAYAGRW